MKTIYRNFLMLLVLMITTSACNGQQPVIDTSQSIAYQKLSDSAVTYEKNGDQRTALRYHKLALKHARDFKLPEKEARTLVNIAMLLKKQDSGASLEHLKGALSIAERLGNHELKADILLALSGVYKQQENYIEALSALESHQKLLKETFARSRAHQLALVRATETAKLQRYVFLGASILVLLVGLATYLYFIRISTLNRQLRASNLIKDKLFSIIGHDLRGPAGGIMEALDMVDSGILDDQEQREVIGLLKKQSRSFNETLNSLLSWATTQLQGTQTHASRFDLRIIVQKSMEVLAGLARQKNLSIQDQVPESLFVLADMNHVDFVIRNLLSNAIKFSYENGSIEILAKQEDVQVLISVTDHGTGISEVKRRQFEVSSSYMESSFGTKGEPGTGLGLMLSREFLLANNGRMWMESTEGNGTTVFVALKNSELG